MLPSTQIKIFSLETFQRTAVLFNKNGIIVKAIIWYNRENLNF